MAETRKPVLIPDPVVAKERYHVHPHTLRRWDNNPALGFPPVVKVNGRRYREAERILLDEARLALQEQPLRV